MSDEERPRRARVTDDSVGGGNGGYVVAIDAFHFDEGISFADLFRVIWEHKLILIIAAVIGGIIGLLLTTIVDKRYEASTTVIWAGTGSDTAAFGNLGGQLGSIASVAGLLPNADEAKQEALAILRSRAFTESFIEDNDLMPVLYQDQWDSTSGEWLSDFADDPPTIRDAFELFDSKVRSIEEDSRAGVIHVTVEWKDPGIAADWANRIIARVNEQIRQRQIREGEASIGFLQKELTSQKNIELRNAIFRMMESQLNAIMIAQVKPDFAFRVVDPAVALDPDDNSFPNRLLFLLSGVILAGALTLAFILIRRAVASN